MKDYFGKKVLILGMGKSGISMARFLHQRGALCLAFDDNSKLEQYGDFCPIFSKIEDIDFNQLDAVVASPGVSPEHQVYKKALEKSLPIKGEVQLGLEAITNTCIAVTGTNGKSTLTSLISHVLNSSGLKARAVGNIGLPITSIVDKIEPHEVVVVELSSYQIDSLQSICLDLALLLNITPDHLERYGSMENYAKAKLSITNYIKKEGFLFTAKSLANQWRDYLSFKRIKFYDGELKRLLKLLGKNDSEVGSFQEQNLSAVIAVLRFFNIAIRDIEEGLKSFTGLPHRCEYVETFDGTHFYNDSKATNIESVIKALTSFKKPIHLIMGGDDKNLDYSNLKPYFLDKVKEIYFIGQVKEKMAKVFEKEYSVNLCSSLEEATREAYKKSGTDEIVLLSPGTSSFGMFNSFEHRGDEFKRIVKHLEGEK